jgi:hypothetical protein
MIKKDSGAVAGAVQVQFGKIILLRVYYEHYNKSPR